MGSDLDNHASAQTPLSSSKSLLIWGGDDILSAYIESLVAGHGGWNVARLLKSNGMEALNQALDEHCPDILIVLQMLRNGSEELSLQLMQVHTGMQVILVSLENNVILVVSKHEILAAHSEDLILVIEDELNFSGR